MRNSALLDRSVVTSRLSLAPPSRSSEAPAAAAPRRWTRVPASPALPWLVASLGFSVSLWLFTLLGDAVENVAKLRFERQADDAGTVIEQRVGFYIDILHSVRALFASQGPVSRLQFHQYIQSLDLKTRYPGFDLVNFAAYVRGADKDQFESSVRRDTSIDPRGYPNFRIKPPGDRDEYFVIVYLEPMKSFEFAFGLDLGASPAVSDPGAVAATQRAARDSGRLTASGQPIKVKTAREEYTGLAVRMPIYRSDMPSASVEERRAAYLGSVGAGFNVDHLMDRVLDAETSKYMHFTLVDVGPAVRAPDAPKPPERLLYDSRKASGGTEQTGDAFTSAISLEVGGRAWEVRFTGLKKAVIGRVDTLVPWFVLLGGALSSVLMALVFYSLASSRSRAEKLAAEITGSLRESEANLAEAHALLTDAQKLARVGYCHYSPGERRMTWSEELYRMHGVDPREFKPGYASAMELVHPLDRAAWHETLTNALSNGEPFAAEFRIIRSDGSIRHLRSLGEVMRDTTGSAIRMLWSVLDITEHRQTEQALRGSAEQLAALSRRLVEVQEAERRQLSRELHDRVGQNLTALSINLDILRTTLAGDGFAEQRARLNDSCTLLESTADSIENVMSELRPPMLDDYGLLSALQWYAKDFSKRTGIEVEVSGDDNAERPAPELEIALFRIAQEALTNVAKHARATRVEVALDHTDGRCEMTVTDDGIGVDLAERGHAQRQGLGMMTMRERTQAIGGRFSVRRAHGGGTQVTISIP